MKKIFILLFVAAILGAVVLAFKFFRGPDLRIYEALKAPRISAKPDQKVLIVTAKGNPNVIGKRAFSTLYKTYFKLRDVPKTKLIPRARWEAGSADDLDTALGHYALPVPDSVTAVPAGEIPAGLEIKIAAWKYGNVAEILHIGPYEKETPTVERLKDFIKESGYEIAGLHEEEYVKGPGMFGKGNPEKYYTIIRYPIEKINP